MISSKEDFLGFMSELDTFDNITFVLLDWVLSNHALHQRDRHDQSWRMHFSDERITINLFVHFSALTSTQTRSSSCN